MYLCQEGEGEGGGEKQHIYNRPQGGTSSPTEGGFMEGVFMGRGYGIRVFCIGVLWWTGYQGEVLGSLQISHKHPLGMGG